jgi:hypothetical protein
MRYALRQVSLVELNKMANKVKSFGKPQFFCVLPSGNIELYPRPKEGIEFYIQV